MNYRQFHFSLRHRLIASISGLFTNNAYTCRHGLTRGMRRKGGLGFLPAIVAHTESRETQYFASLDLTGRTVYDIGGFEGLLTMYFARSAEHVVTYEPMTRNYERAAANIALNHLNNVTLRKVAAGDHTSEEKVYYDPLMPGGASADSNVGAQIRSGSDAAKSEVIQIRRLDDDIAANGLPPPDYIKIDIEGMEASALRGLERTLRQYHPAIYVEMHGTDRENKRQKLLEVVAFLTGIGYRQVLHVEGGKTLSGDDLDRQSHICCCTGPVCCAIDGTERQYCPVKRQIYYNSLKSQAL